MTDREAIDAARRGQRVETKHSLFPADHIPHECPHLDGFRIIACDGMTDVIECPGCGTQKLVACNFDEDFA